MIGEPQKFNFIDALRGFAILAVILVHAQGAVSPSNALLTTLMASGARGVQLFYIASALTLCHSWAVRFGREPRPVRNFYLRRLFRIVPMFYIAIAGYLVLYGLTPRYYAPDGIRWYYVPLTAAFLNGFHPETITSVVPGGWSIVVEMTFYLFFPFLVTRFRSPARLLLLLLTSLLFAEVAARLAYRVYAPDYAASQLYLVDTLASLNFFSQFPVFVFGMLAYWLFANPQHWKLGVTLGAAALIAWIGVWMRIHEHAALAVLARPIEMGAAFALASLLLSRYPSRVLVNPLTIWIGRLSFSMYLIHFAVLDLLGALGISALFPRSNAGALSHYVLVVMLASLLSWVSYRLIERPAIAAGARLIARLTPAV